jgi:alkylation response protein AidB-like acyl-CoA dehydrogenase
MSGESDMQLADSAEQRELRASVRRFLEDKSSVAAVRELMETVPGYDDAVWKQAGTQLGLPGLAIPEEYGGAGFSFVEQAIVLEEMGRSLYCGPYFASAVLAANALLCCPDEAAKHQ